MSLTINDNITIGSYQFPYNPGSYQVSFEKFQYKKRSINGTLQKTTVSNGAGKALLKRNFSMGGLSFNMIDSILAEFEKDDELPFISPESKTYTIVFSDFGYDMNQDNPLHPTYTITLTEV